MIRQKLSDVNQFLDQKRVAMVGASRNPENISRMLMKTMTEHGIDVIPVHLEAEEIDGQKCYAHLADIEPKPAAAMVVLDKGKFSGVVDECVEAGIKNVWLYGVTGPKSIDEDLQKYCLERDLNLVAGWCPFMFLPNADKGHKVHGFIWKMIGLYPKKK